MEVYLDNNATTPVAPEVLESMMPFLKTEYGNPSSLHNIGSRVKKHVDEAREKVAAMLNAHPDEIVFTSCGTESDNTALRGALEARPGRKRIVTTSVEHPAIREASHYLAANGYDVTELRVDAEGMLDMEHLEESLTGDTAIVSVMWANNETGVIFPVEEVAGLVREKGILFHTDAVQAAGKIPIDMAGTPVDMLSISGHKLHTPKGIGVLYVRKGAEIKPLMVGGHQERNFRAGTENVPYIVGLGRACELAAEGMEEENTRVKLLRDKLENALMDKCPDARRNGHPLNRLPNTSNISFEYVEGESILLMLDYAGIAVSTGSACSSGSLEPSHVLTAMDIPFTAKHGSVRFSLSRYNTEQEIDYVIEQTPPIIKRLREMSPIVKQ